MTIQHIEIHTAHNHSEAIKLEAGGLPKINDAQTCANCAGPVGYYQERFIPLAHVLREDQHWLLCMACASPIVRPRN